MNQRVRFNTIRIELYGAVDSDATAILSEVVAETPLKGSKADDWFEAVAIETARRLLAAGKITDNDVVTAACDPPGPWLSGKQVTVELVIKIDRKPVKTAEA